MHKSLTTYSCYVLLFAFCLLLMQCAQIVVPGGGPKDIQSPRVEKYIPDSAATNFTAKNITIVFDEYIQLVDLQKELTVSPPMGIQPEVRAKGKTLLIEIKDTLKKNTTYVLNFGSSVRDFTEINTKTDFQYIFSTGNIIDTLRMSGVVKNAYDQKIDKGILVMLYENATDSAPYKTGPSYFAKTNADGAYKISNIRPGTYKAFVLKDANSNFRYDVPSEGIAFSDTLVKISGNTKLDFWMFTDEPQKQRLLKNSIRGYGSMMLMYAKPVSEISFRPLNSTTQTETFIAEFNTQRDSIRVWFPVFSKDSLHFSVMADKNPADTIKIGTKQFQKDGGGRGEVFQLSALLNVSKDKPLNPKRRLTLTFNYPIKNVKSNEIYLMQGKQKINYTNTVIADKINRKFSFQFPLQQDSLYRLLILPGTFTDIFGLTNDTIKAEFKLQEEKQYGSMKLNLTIKSETAILQFINDKGEIFEPEGFEKNILTFTFLPPGNYTMRIIYDTNGDGKWTPGNYTLRKQPEKVVYYSGPIIIRSNWDSELEWKVD